MSTEIILMGGFLLLIIFVLMIDLLVVGRNSHVVSTKEALGWTSIWFMLAMGFYVFLMFYGHLLHGITSKEELLGVVTRYAPELHFQLTDFEGMVGEYRNHMATSYLAGYFIEQTLSIDNVFVILLILQGFSVPLKNWHLQTALSLLKSRRLVIKLRKVFLPGSTILRTMNSLTG
jgi:tellurite resistance protein TerC